MITGLGGRDEISFSKNFSVLSWFYMRLAFSSGAGVGCLRINLSAIWGLFKRSENGIGTEFTSLRIKSRLS